MIFEGQALRELVDYRGAHGVRWVMNGVLLGGTVMNCVARGARLRVCQSHIVWAFWLGRPICCMSYTILCVSHKGIVPLRLRLDYRGYWVSTLKLSSKCTENCHGGASHGSMWVIAGGADPHWRCDGRSRKACWGRLQLHGA